MKRLLNGGVIAALWTMATPALAADLVTNGSFTAGATGYTTTYSGASAFSGATFVTTNPNAVCSCFVSMGDHTSGTGNMLLLDGAGTGDAF